PLQGKGVLTALHHHARFQPYIISAGEEPHDLSRTSILLPALKPRSSLTTPSTALRRMFCTKGTIGTAAPSTRSSTSGRQSRQSSLLAFCWTTSPVSSRQLRPQAEQHSGSKEGSGAKARSSTKSTRLSGSWRALKTGRP